MSRLSILNKTIIVFISTTNLIYHSSVNYLPASAEVKLYILTLGLIFFIIPAILIFISYIIIFIAFKKSSRTLKLVDGETQSSTSSVDRRQLSGCSNFKFRRVRGFNRIRDSLRLKTFANNCDKNAESDSLSSERRASAGAAISSNTNKTVPGLTIAERRIEFKRFLSESIVSDNRPDARRNIIIRPLRPLRPLRPSIKRHRAKAAAIDSNQQSLVSINSKKFHSTDRDSESDIIARTPSGIIKQSFSGLHISRFKGQPKATQPNQLKSRSNLQLRLAKTSLYLILLWLVSWTPLGLLALINSIANCRRASPLAVFLASTMTKLGPTFDVFIYGISHPKIKSRFKQIIKRLLLMGPAASRDAYNMALRRLRSLCERQSGS